MRKWDIVNVVEPGEFEVTQTKRDRVPMHGIITSAVKAAFVIGVAVASSSQFTIKTVRPASTVAATVRFVDSRPFAPAAPPGARGRISAEVDTQFGQSTSKLAQLFETYFVRTSDEEPYDEDYSF